ncbi:hypothetical protein Rhopal_000886-T1 [Rhodotorula paludigena]|uniref:mannan endo-1,4-beta-mannosidase n=1 Tax=Rhodotorula paludigena TaxID=86838 RepID=A0AAV5G5V6_9BASI|nr:hypothetical protein Rhopal_000886-T1 [Rhodotorula paludigena]
MTTTTTRATTTTTTARATTTTAAASFNCATSSDCRTGAFAIPANGYAGCNRNQGICVWGRFDLHWDGRGYDDSPCLDPTSFVKRPKDSQLLTLDNKPYRIVGPSRIREALAIAIAMGANTVRVHTCGISVGPSNEWNLNPEPGVFRESAWDIRDYVIYAAREYGLRLIFPLTDNWDYYHGGKCNFVDFAGLSRDRNCAKFYESKVPIRYFTEYISRIIQRQNPYTGLTYGNDPTILAWETGNELGGYINAEMWPPASWTNAIIDTIRKYDSQHLIVDGSGGFWNYSTKATAPGLTVPRVDLMSDHGYPRNLGILAEEVKLATQAKKGFFIGEYDWTPTGSSVSLEDYLAAIERSGAYLGDMIWSVFGHDDECCAFVKHQDGYSLYYPNGGTAGENANALLVAQHWYRVQGRPVPRALPAVACPQPAF